MSTKIKICGITNKVDAELCAGYGADALGFVFYEKSPRYITPDAAGEIIADLPPFISTVGVFVDEEPKKVEATIKTAGLTIAQLHGTESPDYCAALKGRAIKAVRVRDAESLKGLDDYKSCAVLLDTYVKDQPGGTGLCFDWSLLREMDYKGHLILSGGLTPDNIEEALRGYAPYGVDASSGVESEPGRKDPEKLRAFIEKVRSFTNV